MRPGNPLKQHLRGPGLLHTLPTKLKSLSASTVKATVRTSPRPCTSSRVSRLASSDTRKLCKCACAHLLSGYLTQVGKLLLSALHQTFHAADGSEVAYPDQMCRCLMVSRWLSYRQQEKAIQMQIASGLVSGVAKTPVKSHELVMML